MKVSWPILVLLTSLSGLSHAARIDEARQSLKKWGMAYCLSSAGSNAAVKEEAGKAMGAYFQLGRHDDEKAYANIRKFISTELLSNPRVSKQDGHVVALVSCLDILESKSFLLIVRKQDKYVSR